MSQHQKIKVTIITGFLGAGKTTFINQVLKQNRETRFALVENEFGEVSIDSKLVKGMDASQMFELKQGCICCTIAGEFELVLQELAQRFPNTEQLLIETTGIADPALVIRPFFADENLKEIYEYNGTICLVDALNFQNSPERELILKQIVVADLVPISKTGKLTVPEKQKIGDLIKKINPFAETKIFLPQTDLEIQLHSVLQKKRSIFDFVSPNSNHSGIQSLTFTFDHLLNKNEFVRWLEYTLDIYKTKIYRTKGILSFENEIYESVLQGVGGSFELTEGGRFAGEQSGKLVFIGKLEGLNLEF